jgi:hypothetical protein
VLVAVEPEVVQVPRQEHALEIFEGIAEHAEAYDGIVVLLYPGEVYCSQNPAQAWNSLGVLSEHCQHRNLQLPDEAREAKEKTPRLSISDFRI